jgi:hypothetical protein
MPDTQHTTNQDPFAPYPDNGAVYLGRHPARQRAADAPDVPQDPRGEPDVPFYRNQPTSPPTPASPEYAANFQPIVPARGDILVPNLPEYEEVLKSLPYENIVMGYTLFGGGPFPIDLMKIIKDKKPKIEDFIFGMVDKKFWNSDKESPFRHRKILHENHNCYIPYKHYSTLKEIDSVMTPVLEQWMARKALWAIVNVGTMGGIEDGWYELDALKVIERDWLDRNWVKIGFRSEVIYRHRETESERESYRTLMEATTTVPLREADGYIRSRGYDSPSPAGPRRHSQQVVQGNYETSTASTTSQEVWAIGRGGNVTQISSNDNITTTVAALPSHSHVTMGEEVAATDGRHYDWNEFRQRWMPRS